MLETWLLAFCRLAPVAALHPVFGARAVPRAVTVGVAAALACVAVSGRPTPVVATLSALAWAAVREVIVGTAIGLLGQAVFGAIEAAGRLVDDARGANVAHLYAPQLEAVASPLGQLELTASLAVFWGAALYRPMLAGLFASLDSLPLGVAPPTSESVGMLFDIAGTLARAAFALAGPAAACCVLVDAGMGLVNRAAPSANVFLLGQPVKLVAAVLVAAAGAEARMASWGEIWRHQQEWALRLFGM